MSILSEKEISRNCFLSTSFGKAKKLYQNNDVTEISIQKTAKDMVRINAKVNGNSKSSYDTSIEFCYHANKNGNKRAKVDTCSCECEAYKTYKGFCKHIAATVLKANEMFDDMQIKDILEYCAVGYQISYSNKELYGTDDEGDIEDFMASNDMYTDDLYPDGTYLDDTYSSAPKTSYDAEDDIFFDMDDRRRRFMYDAMSNILEMVSGVPGNNWMPYSGMSGNDKFGKNQNVQKSSKKLLDIMSGVVLKERNKFCQELTGGHVELEVILNLNDGEKPKIEFRIGSNQMYVVKNIPEFVNHIRNQDMVKYGKNLQFAHHQSDFTRDSLPVISLLMAADIKTSPYHYSNANDRRYLVLTPQMTDALMEHFEGKSINTKGSISYEYSSLKVKREDPKLEVYIDGIDSGKRAVITFSEIRLLEGVNRFYVLHDGIIYICSDEYCEDMREIVKLMIKKNNRQYNYYYYRNYEEYGNLELAESDYSYFCATLLPIFEKYMKVEIKDVAFEKYHAEEGKYELYFELKNGNDIVCKAKALYGEKEHNLISVAAVNENYRDIKTEYELRTILNNYLPEKTKDGESYLLREDDERLAALIEYGIDELKTIADVFVSEDFKKIKIADNIKFTTGLSIKGNLLKVSWDVEGMPKNELYDILSSYNKKKKYYRLKSGELLNLSDSGLDVLAGMNDNLRLSKTQIMDGMAEVPMYRSLYMDMLVEENKEKIQAVKSESFKKLIDNFENIKGKNYELPDNVTANLREYQLQGYKWACSLAEFGFGGILADDMGLGKTLQMISYLCSLKHNSSKKKTHIVICPASLVYNWDAEFDKFARETSVCVVVGSAAQRMALIRDCEQYDVLITSYDLLKRDIEYYSGKEFGCEIIDEAQYIKNPTTQAAKAVRAIKSENRFALTGTPIENRLSELWSIFEFLMPGYLYSYKHFKEKFEEKIMAVTDNSDNNNDNNRDNAIINNEKIDRNSSLVMLHKMISPFILRRLKKDVLTELPDKIEKVVYTKFESEQEKLYRATEKNIIMNIGKKSGKEFMESKLQILAELTKLRQICCDPSLLYSDYKGRCAKLDTCIELIESAIDGGHRILLFSQFATMLKIIDERLKKCGIRTLTLTGSTSKVSRRNMVEQFQNGKAEVFLISLKAGGTGLNLTSADMVIHYDPWWNVAAQNQATDRAHRIGQENKVTVIRLIAKDTIEERILKLQEKKKELADKVMAGENVSMASLTKEDLLELFA